MGSAVYPQLQVPFSGAVLALAGLQALFILNNGIPHRDDGTHC